MSSYSSTLSHNPPQMETPHPYSPLFTLPLEILQQIASSLRDAGQLCSLSNLSLTNQYIRDAILRELFHTIYVVFRRILKPSPSQYPKDERLYSQERFVDIDKSNAPASVEAIDRDERLNEGRTLRQLRRAIDRIPALGLHGRKLVIKSKAEYVDRVSYQICPVLLHQVMQKLPQLKSLRVGNLGIVSPRKAVIAPRKMELQTLEAIWDPLESRPRKGVRPWQRTDVPAFGTLLQTFDKIGTLRFVYYSSSGGGSDDLSLPERPTRLKVDTVQLLARMPLTGRVSRVLRLLGQIINPVSLKTLKIDDGCHLRGDSIQTFLQFATYLRRISLNFRQVVPQRFIGPDHVDLSKQKSLEHLELSVLARPSTQQQLEWDRAMATLGSASGTPCQSILLRLTPLTLLEDGQWSSDETDEDPRFLVSSPPPAVQWHSLHETLKSGFKKLRSFEVQLGGPLSWIKHEIDMAKCLLEGQNVVLTSVEWPQSVTAEEN